MFQHVRLTLPVAVASLLLALCALPPAAAQPQVLSWSQFLGPNRNGISHETGLNLDWKARPPQVAWKVELGGGFSSMSFAEQRLFTMTERGEREYVVCIDRRSGKELWTYDIAPKYIDWGNFGAGPRSTPTYDKGHLYCLSPLGDLCKLRAVDGRMLWRVNVFEASGAKDPTGEHQYWGMSVSPLVEGNLVIVQPGGDSNNSVAAFNTLDGRVVWSAGNDVPGYGSPIAITAAGRRQVICTTGKSILSVDPKDGEVLWRFPWDNKVNMNSATPLWVDNTLFISALHEPGAAALEIVTENGAPTARARWHNEDMKNHFATSIALDGYVYGTHGGGGCTLRCLDLKTGELKWADRATGKSSLIAVEGQLIAWSEDGTLRLVKVSPAGAVVKGEIQLLKPKAWAAPALSDGRLYVRDEKHLVCVDLRGG